MIKYTLEAKEIGGYFMKYMEKTQVYNLPLSTGTKNLLMRRGYTDIVQLLSLDYEGFKKIPGMGDGTIKEITDCLLGLGYILEHKEDIKEKLKPISKPKFTLENISINELTNIIVAIEEENKTLNEINKKKLDLLMTYKIVLLEQQQLIKKEEELDKELEETKQASKTLRRKIK